MSEYQNVDADELDFKPIQLKEAEGKDPFEQSVVEKKLVEKHVSQFKDWENWRRPFENIWLEAYALYLTVSRAQKLPTRAKVAVPIIFQVIEAAVPKLISIIFGQNPFFQVVNRFAYKKDVDPQILDDIYTLLDYQLDLSQFFLKFIEFAKQMFLYGTSYFHVYWKVKREWVWERKPVRTPYSVFGFRLPFMDLKWEKKLEYKVVERRPEVEVLAIEDVYPDPKARNEQNSEGIYVVSTMSMDELKELSSGRFPVFTNFDQVERTKESSNEAQFKVDKRTVRGTGDAKKVQQKKNEVEIITYWGREDIDGDGIREEVQLVFANRSVLIKAIRNPFEHQKRPIIRSVLFPVPLEWFGVGLVEPVIPLVHELDTIRNQNIDVNNLIINRMWKVKSTADVDLDTLISGPNNIVLTDDMEAVQTLPQENLPFSPTQLSEMIQRDIESATAPKSIQGSSESGALGRTARGAQLIISQALEKFGMGAKMVEESAVKQVLKMYYALDLQYLDNDQILEDPLLYGQVWAEKKTPEQIRADVDFKLLGISETVTKEAMVNQIIAFVNTFGQIPGINLIEVAKVVWDLMQLKTPSSQVINPAPFPVQQVSQFMQNPNVSEASEQAVANQIQQNGAGGQLNIPKQ